MDIDLTGKKIFIATDRQPSARMLADEIIKAGGNVFISGNTPHLPYLVNEIAEEIGEQKPDVVLIHYPSVHLQSGRKSTQQLMEKINAMDTKPRIAIYDHWLEDEQNRRKFRTMGALTFGQENSYEQMFFKLKDAMTAKVGMKIG